MPDGDLLTLDAAAEYLQVSRRTVDRWLAEGRLTAIRLGPRTRRISRGDLAQFLNQGRSEQD